MNTEPAKPTFDWSLAPLGQALLSIVSPFSPQIHYASNVKVVELGEKRFVVGGLVGAMTLAREKILKVETPHGWALVAVSEQVYEEQPDVIDVQYRLHRLYSDVIDHLKIKAWMNEE